MTEDRSTADEPEQPRRLFFDDLAADAEPAETGPDQPPAERPTTSTPRWRPVTFDGDPLADTGPIDPVTGGPEDPPPAEAADELPFDDPERALEPASPVATATGDGGGNRNRNRRALVVVCAAVVMLVVVGVLISTVGGGTKKSASDRPTPRAVAPTTTGLSYLGSGSAAITTPPESSAGAPSGLPRATAATAPPSAAGTPRVPHAITPSTAVPSPTVPSPTVPSPAVSSPTVPSPAVPSSAPAGVSLTVLNNTSVTGLAHNAAQAFSSRGWTIGAVSNYTGRLATTTVFYDPRVPSEVSAARTLAAQYPSVTTVQPRTPGIPGSGLTVVLAPNWRG